MGGGCLLGNGEEPLLGVAIRGGKLGGLLGLAVTEDFFGTTVMVGVPVAAVAGFAEELDDVGDDELLLVKESWSLPYPLSEEVSSSCKSIFSTNFSIAR